MKKVAILITVFIAVAFIGSALAVPAGKTIDYPGGALGKVVFDGKTHADAGNKCTDCHSGIFQMKKNVTKITAPHKPGELCGSCHNGEKGFDQAGNCAKCHKK